MNMISSEWFYLNFQFAKSILGCYQRSNMSSYPKTDLNQIDNGSFHKAGNTSLHGILYGILNTGQGRE